MTPRSITKSWVLVGMILGLACSAHARLGETVAQIEARYGKPSETSSNGVRSSASYSKDGIAVKVDFVNRASWQETYCKPSADQQGAFEPFLRKEIDAFLEANAAGQAWDGPTKPGGNMWGGWDWRWKRTDGATAAWENPNTYNYPHGGFPTPFAHFTITAPGSVLKKALDAEREAEQAEKDKNTKVPSGF